MLRSLTKKFLLAHIPALIAAVFLMAHSALLLMAFEAHVVNVTATIEPPPAQCDARSLGYWSNHEGCSKGKGSSIWTGQIHVMTSNFSGVFYAITGEEICADVWMPNCPSGNDLLARRCRATAMTLADELNLVAGHLQLDALIAGADDGSSAFDHLGLNASSTIQQAVGKIEMILGNNNSTAGQLLDAAYVAERIYSFYEDEDGSASQCVYTPPPTTCKDTPKGDGSGTDATSSVDTLGGGKNKQDDSATSTDATATSSDTFIDTSGNDSSTATSTDGTATSTDSSDGKDKKNKHDDFATNTDATVSSPDNVSDTSSATGTGAGATSSDTFIDTSGNDSSSATSTDGTATSTDTNGKNNGKGSDGNNGHGRQ